jgi:hypothetical protein
MIIDKIVARQLDARCHGVHEEMGNCSRIEALQSVREEVEYLFAQYEDKLYGLKVHAEAVSSAIEAAGFFIERHTSVVCPECPQVCCINRHSYHEPRDVVCICALGKRLPAFKKEAVDTEPCQFLGEKGCTLRRPLRPHRCNWYFCGPLLEHMQTAPVRQYRRFIADLRDINEKREGVINAFARALKRAGYDFGNLKRALDEIFFT